MEILKITSLNQMFALIQEKISTWIELAIKMLPNIAIALMAIAVFFIIAKTAKRLVRKVLNKISENKAVNGLIQSLTYLTIVGLGFFIALSILNLDKTIASLLAGVGVIGLALGFAFQETATNFMSGIFLSIRRPFKIGDIIKNSGYFGTVKSINLRTTTVNTFQGQEIIIPNKELFQGVIENFSSSGERRVDLEVGVSYNDDLEKVQTIAENTVKEFDFYLDEKGIQFFYESFGNSSINFSLRFWIEYPDHPGYLLAKSKAIIAIKKAFDKNGISIPFPIRTLDFGEKVQEKLLTL